MRWLVLVMRNLSRIRTILCWWYDDIRVAGCVVRPVPVQGPCV